MDLRISPFDNYFTIQVVADKGKELNVPIDLSNTTEVLLNFSDDADAVSSNIKTISSKDDLKNGVLNFLIRAKESQKIRTFKSRRYSISAKKINVDGTVDESGLAYGEWVIYEKVAETTYTKDIPALTSQMNQDKKVITATDKSIVDTDKLIDQEGKKKSELEAELSVLVAAKNRYEIRYTTAQAKTQTQ
jgi:hypothetical protein